MRALYTITSQTAQVRYAGNGVTTAFSVTFQFFEASTLRVRTAIADVVALKVLNTDYTVSGGAGSTGTVTFGTAPPTGTNVIIDLNMPMLQETVDLAPNGPLPAEDVEQGFDRIVTMVKQLRQQLLAVPELDATFNPDTDQPPLLPPPAAGEVLVGRSDGLGWENTLPAALEFTTLQSTFSIENLADLKGLTIRPSVVVVKNGQAAGAWQWVANSTSTADDALVVNPSSGDAGRYKRIYSGAIHAVWFGVAAAATGAVNGAALQAAVDAAGASAKKLVLPSFAFNINVAANMSVDGVHVEGMGRDATVVYQQTLNAKIFNVTGNKCSIKSLSLDYDGTPTTGATAIQNTGAECQFSDFKINRCHRGVLNYGGDSVQVYNFYIANYVDAGVIADGTASLVGDMVVRDFVLHAVSQANGAGGGIALINGVEALQMSNGDVLGGAYPIVTSASVYGAMTRPAYCTLTNVFFDSAENAAFLNDIVGFNFTDCWFSNGRSGGGAYGCNLGRSEDVQFNGTKFVNCGAGGCYVSPLAVNPQFNHCQALGNSVTTGAGVSAGLLVDAGVDGLSVQGGRYGNDLFVGVQGHGIYIVAGCTNYSVIGADVRDNSVAPLFDGPAEAGAITRCKGYVTEKNGTASVASGSTTAVVTHGLSKTPTAADVYVTFTEQGTSDYGRWWISGISSTQFTLNVSANPGASNLDFSWGARVL